MPRRVWAAPPTLIEQRFEGMWVVTPTLVASEGAEMSEIERAGAVAVDAVGALLADASARLPLASVDEVADLLARAGELTRLIDGLQVRVAAEVDDRSKLPVEQSLCRILGNRSAKELLTSAFGSRSRSTLDLMAVVDATRTTIGLSGATVPARFPRVGEALATGAVSFEQAHAIVQVLAPAAPRADLDDLAWAEGALVDAATDAEAPLVPDLLKVQGRAYAAVLDPDGLLPDADRQRAMRSLTTWRRRDGMWKTVVISPPEEGSALKALMDAYTGPRVKVAFHDDEGAATADGAAADGATAGGAAAGGTTAGGVDSDDEASVEDRTQPQLRHDVLMGLVRAHAASGDAPTVGGEAPVLVLTGTIEAYTAYLEGAAHRQPCLRIEHTGDLVPIERSAALLCDGRVQLAVHDAVDHHHVLQLGRSQRLFTSVQRRALALRDEGCRASGCRMPPSWCEAHHVRPWEAGGPTDIENGILLCTYHHHEVHAGRLVVEPAGLRPGSWRVVSQLLPLRRRTVIATPALELAASAAEGVTPRLPGSLAAAAPAALAVRIPDLQRNRHRARGATAGLSSAAARGPRGATAGLSSAAARGPSGAHTRTFEQRLRRRLDSRSGGWRGGRRDGRLDNSVRHAGFDLRPPPLIVLRT